MDADCLATGQRHEISQCHWQVGPREHEDTMAEASSRALHKYPQNTSIPRACPCVTGALEYSVSIHDYTQSMYLCSQSMYIYP